MATILPSQAKRGGLKDTDAIDLLATVFKAVLERTHVEPQVCLCPRLRPNWAAQKALRHPMLSPPPPLLPLSVALAAYQTLLTTKPRPARPLLASPLSTARQSATL